MLFRFPYTLLLLKGNLTRFYSLSTMEIALIFFVRMMMVETAQRDVSFKEYQ